MTPEEYQALLDAGWTAEEIESTFGVAPPEGAQGAPASGGTAGTSAYGSKPDNVPDWLWQRYLLANKEYDEAWNDNKEGIALPGDTSGKTRFDNARSLLTSVLGQMDNYMPKKPTSPDWDTTSTSSPYLVRPKPDGTLEQIPNPNYRPPGADRDPLDQTYKQLQIQKAQRDLMDDYSLAREQQYKMIADIQRRLADGDIDEKEADRLMGMANQSFNASLKGTTPFQMEQAKTGLARSTLNDRMGMGQSMALGLINGIGGGYGKMYASTKPPTNFNPLMMAKDFTDEMGGGADMSELAKAILRGALGGQQGG